MNINILNAKKNIIFLIGLIIVIAFFYKILDVVLLFFTGFVLASAMNPLVNRLSKKMSRKFALLLIYFIGFVIFINIVIPLIKIIINETASFAQQLPIFWSQTDKFINKITLMTSKWGFLHNSSLNINKFDQYITLLISKSLNYTYEVFSGIGIIITLIVITYFILEDKEHLKSSFLDFFPKDMRDQADAIFISVSNKVGKYVTCQLIAMGITAVLTTIGLAIAGIKYSVLFGIITGILDIVPVAGVIIAFIPTALVALAIKPILFIWVLGIFVIVQWIGNAIIRPIIFHKKMNLNNLLILFSFIVAEKLLGIIGIILAPVIAVTIQVLIQELYIKRISPEKAQ